MRRILTLQYGDGNGKVIRMFTGEHVRMLDTNEVGVLIDIVDRGFGRSLVPVVEIVDSTGKRTTREVDDAFLLRPAED